MRIHWMRALVGFVILGLVACNGSADSENNIETDTNNIKKQEKTIEKKSKSLSDLYDAAEFSKYVFISKDKKGILIDFNFFPSGTNFDQKFFELPCDAGAIAEGVSFSIVAPVDGAKDCERASFEYSPGQMKLYGLEFSVERTIEIFADDFGFVVNQDGFFDVATGEPIDVDFEDATLQNIEAAVVEGQTLN